MTYLWNSVIGGETNSILSIIEKGKVRQQQHSSKSFVDTWIIKKTLLAGGGKKRQVRQYWGTVSTPKRVQHWLGELEKVWDRPFPGVSCSEIPRQMFSKASQGVPGWQRPWKSESARQRCSVQSLRTSRASYRMAPPCRKWKEKHTKNREVEF